MLVIYNGNIEQKGEPRKFHVSSANCHEATNRAKRKGQSLHKRKKKKNHTWENQTSTYKKIKLGASLRNTQS